MSNDIIANAGTSARPTSRPVSAKARELLQDQAHGLPVWIRPPTSGLEFYSGLSRSKLYELAGAGKIKSVSIREPGQVKGTRLFLLTSIFSFIESCAEGTAKNEN